MRLSLPRLIVTVLLISIPAFSVAAQQNLKIAKIEFEGLSRLSAEEMIATTGLKIGAPFSLATLDAAAQRLWIAGSSRMSLTERVPPVIR